jgi:hypothetical protein
MLDVSGAARVSSVVGALRMAGTENPFAFLLRKPRQCLDAQFYRAARSFADIDDEMWRYLLGLMPKGRGAYGRRVRRLLEKLNPALRRYFLIRWFDGEWGSEGMEGLCTSPDWLEVRSELVRAFAELGAIKHADMIETLPREVERAQRARTEAEQESLLPLFKRLDRKWQNLARTENLEEMLFNSVKADCTPYLHPPEPQQDAPPNRRPPRLLEVRRSGKGGGR